MTFCREIHPWYRFIASMRLHCNRLISYGALVALIGYIMSGPVAFFIVSVVNPQPPWESSALFAENYHTIQDTPYYFGFLLVGGMLMVTAGHYLNYKGSNPVKKFHMLLSVAWTIIFATLIMFNYVSQISFVRNLAVNYKPEYDAAIQIFSMSNPLSFCWANEMWGYGFLGLATILLSGYYQHDSKVIYLLLIVNGFVSLLSAIMTLIDATWVMTTIGLFCYFAWNILMIALMMYLYNHAKRQAKLDDAEPIHSN